MSRWDISDPHREHSAPVRSSEEQSRRTPETDRPSVGRAAGAAQDSFEPLNRDERTASVRSHGPHERRSKYFDRGQSYSLRDSELHAMADMGRFRAVDVQDLARFVYQGDQARLKYDLENLRKQGLVEEKIVPRSHKPARRMVTLTSSGHRVIRQAGVLPESQRVYHGFVKPKELEHDADLYKVYQKATQEIRAKGAKPTRVRLDFELKESINRAREAVGRLPEAMRQRWLAVVAEQQGLTIEGRAIHLPDLQVEFETPDGRLQRENLELVSQNYREVGIRGKAAAGFKIYARASETNRTRRALRDTGLVREVLSV